MKLHHIAIWTYKLEELRDFYTRYFNGKSNQKYVNSAKAAGTRARKASLEIEKSMKEFRKASLEASKK